MGNSRKTDSNTLLEHVAHALSPVLSAGSSVVLGLSGGVDSVVLLHLLRQISSRDGWQLSALHVHHGISPHADAWAAFCEELCNHQSVTLRIEHVNLTPLRHLGIEAAARTLRHAALARHPSDFIALAHHQDDQAETLLLQLLRGAGTRGVSGMPVLKHRQGVPALLRPLLDIPRSTLLDYAQQHELSWVEDESNHDDAYPRNFMRHRVLPILEQRFPAYRTTLTRSARHFAEASELLDDLARQDAPDIFTSSMQESECETKKLVLEVAPLLALSPARAKNLLRYFIAARGAAMPDSTLLSEILRQLGTARLDSLVCIDWQGWQIRRYRKHVYILPTLPPPIEFNVTWRGEAEISLPQHHGMLHFESALGQGISLEKLKSSTMEIRPRRGGEKMRPDAARPLRTLKNLLQEHGVLPWQRDVLPLLFYGDDLVCVPGVTIACAYQALANEPGLLVRWKQLLA